MAKKQNYLKRKQTFSGAQVLLFVLIFAAVGAVAIWQSLAAPHNGGGKGASGSVSLNLPPLTDNNSDGQPNFGDTINFSISTSVSQPYVNLQCFQNNKLVAEGWRAYYEGSLDWPNGAFGLNGGSWSGGEADCTAYLKYYTGKGKNPWVTITSTSFHVNA